MDAMPPGYAVCPRCATLYDPRDNVARWQCRLHPTAPTTIGRGDGEGHRAPADFAWPMLRCCGLRQGLPARLRGLATVSQATGLGCYPADHGVAFEEAAAAPAVVRCHQPAARRVDARAIVCRLTGGAAQFQREYAALCSDARYARLLAGAPAALMATALARATDVTLAEPAFYAWLADGAAGLTASEVAANPLLAALLAPTAIDWEMLFHAVANRARPPLQQAVVAAAASLGVAGRGGGRAQLSHVALALAALPLEPTRREVAAEVRATLGRAFADEIAPLLLVSRVAFACDSGAVADNAAVAYAAGLPRLEPADQALSPWFR